MELSDEDVKALNRVPSWLKEKIEKRYVTTKLTRDADGCIHLEIGVGGRVVADIVADGHPEEDDVNGWQRMYDVLELWHYGNWMRRFCEAMGRLGDDGVNKAMKECEMPRVFRPLTINDNSHIKKILFPFCMFLFGAAVGIVVRLFI